MNLILTADFHLRKDYPRCRTDEDWEQTQINIVRFILDTAVKHNCDVWNIGDVFHQPRQPEEIINIILDLLKKPKYKNTMMFVDPGNHDLLHNNIKNINKCAIGVLLNGKGVEKIIRSIDDPIVTEHTLVWPSEKVKPSMASGVTPDEMFEKYPKAKWIFTGDYHHNFVAKKGKQTLVNPGCINRQAADMIDYEPIIYYVNTDTGEIKPIKLPDTEDVVTDAHIQKNSERNERMNSFIELLSDKKNVTLDFVSNVKAKIPEIKNKLTKEIVNEVLEEVV